MRAPSAGTGDALLAPFVRADQALQLAQRGDGRARRPRGPRPRRGRRARRAPAAAGWRGRHRRAATGGPCSVARRACVARWRAGRKRGRSARRRCREAPAARRLRARRAGRRGARAPAARPGARCGNHRATAGRCLRWRGERRCSPSTCRRRAAASPAARRGIRTPARAMRLRPSSCHSIQGLSSIHARIMTSTGGRGRRAGPLPSKPAPSLSGSGRRIRRPGTLKTYLRSRRTHWLIRSRDAVGISTQMPPQWM